MPHTVPVTPRHPLTDARTVRFLAVTALFFALAFAAMAAAVWVDHHQSGLTGWQLTAADCAMGALLITIRPRDKTTRTTGPVWSWRSRLRRLAAHALYFAAAFAAMAAGVWINHHQLGLTGWQPTAADCALGALLITATVLAAVRRPAAPTPGSATPWAWEVR